jgi:hypothetical protein
LNTEPTLRNAEEAVFETPKANSLETSLADINEGVAQSIRVSLESLAEYRKVMTPVIKEGEKRIRRSCERLEAMGITDKKGNLLKKKLPSDMQIGSNRDFGG